MNCVITYAAGCLTSVMRYIFLFCKPNIRTLYSYISKDVRIRGCFAKPKNGGGGGGAKKVCKTLVCPHGVAVTTGHLKLLDTIVKTRNASCGSHNIKVKLRFPETVIGVKARQNVTK
jgi:hypothetical protein